MGMWDKHAKPVSRTAGDSGPYKMGALQDFVPNTEPQTNIQFPMVLCVYHTIGRPDADRCGVLVSGG